MRRESTCLFSQCECEAGRLKMVSKKATLESWKGIEIYPQQVGRSYCGCDCGGVVCSCVWCSNGIRKDVVR